MAEIRSSGWETSPLERRGSRRFHGETVAGNSSEAVHDQPSRFTVWRLIVSPSAGGQEKIVEAQPDFGPAWCALGMIDAGLGRKEEAL